MTNNSSIHCDYFPSCPGCELQQNVDLPPIAIEMQKSFSFPLFKKEIIHWRTRAKLAVRGDANIGLFKRGTHDVIDITNCPLHHPAIKHAIALIKQQLRACAVLSYNEETQSGILRYVQLVVQRNTGLIQLSLVVKQNKNLHPLIDALWQQGIWHSIWINIQSQPINRIFGDTWKLARGEEDFFEMFNNQQICFHPACFGQAHLSLFDDILKAFAKKILPNQRVVEYYAGVGVIGLSVAPFSKQVTCVEINPYAKPAFLKSTSHTNVHFIESSTETALSLLNAADVVIVDPPRKGLENQFIQALNAASVKQFIYMSCGPISFQRDYRVLKENGWILEDLQAYLLFPGTNHIELLGFFIRHE
jgi:23S rRNA (uracil1939-C5)-methyltransferase